MTYATLPEATWSTIDIAVETVTEDLELKRRLFAEMEQLARPGCALTSNSSSFPISEICKGLKTQGRMMGLHFFMPAHLIPLVEVVRSIHTDVAQAERIGAIMSSLGKRPVQVKKDVIGFLGNRIQGALMREALWLIEEGVASPEDIDATVRLSFGFRYARRRADRAEGASGWDTTCAVAKIICRPQQCRRPAAVLQRNVDEGRIGFKTKRGFFEWGRCLHRKRARPLRARSSQMSGDLQGGRNSLVGSLRRFIVRSKGIGGIVGGYEAKGRLLLLIQRSVIGHEPHPAVEPQHDVVDRHGQRRD